MYCASNVRPEDWVRQSKIALTDTAQLFGVKYTGASTGSAVGIVTVSSVATHALHFEQGATVGGATSATGDNPRTSPLTPADGVDCSAAGLLTYHAVIRNINAAADWEAWAIGCLPDDAPYSAATSDFVVAADQQCQVDGGYAILCNNTIADYFCAGLTLNGQSSDPHGSDSQVLHELLQVKHEVGGANNSTGLAVVVYECDDVAGTSAAILTLTAASTVDTEVAYPTDAGIGEPVASANTKRIAVKMSATAITDDAGDRLYILGRSYAFGSAVRKSKMWSSY